MGKFEIDRKILEGVHNYSPEENYVEPNEEIKKKLEWFKDQKLALMVHMGLYCDLGTTASWGLSDYDAKWSRAECDWAKDGDEYRDIYFNMNKSFNPVRYNPEQLAELAADNGFKYLIFTTKHHDGFCLWDTKYTDYKTTSPDCPYSANKNADIIKTTFDAFREKGIGIAAYFSKPDWHSEYYWAKDMEYSNPTWRMTSYNPQEYPDLWEKFVQYTHNQLLELVNDYGKLDIVWLDGGQVCKEAGLDIRLGEFAEKARENNPDLLIVDRTIGGEFENYVTPEQIVPDKPMFIPWESNISLGKSFTYRFDDEYKSLKEVLTLFIDILCKGGNFALNISPQPNGVFPKAGIEVMKGVGKFANKYGEAIYGTRPAAPYKSDNVAFTKNDKNVFAFILTEDGKKYEDVFIPYSGDVSKVVLMNDDRNVEFEKTENGFKVMLNGAEDDIALVLKISK